MVVAATVSRDSPAAAHAFMISREFERGQKRTASRMAANRKRISKATRLYIWRLLRMMFFPSSAIYILAKRPVAGPNPTCIAGVKRKNRYVYDYFGRELVEPRIQKIS